ncbi:hypothetical protein HCP57_000128 [Salmonella enterica subsp. enterica]|nr:hypothetical protein [Salmonella enterica subsp. enterica serovar Winterthur]
MFILVFPAPAGINRNAVLHTLYRARVPRASGDKPLAAACKRFWLWCSPRQRG